MKALWQDGKSGKSSLSSICDYMLKNSLVAAFTLSLVTSFSTSVPRSGKTAFISFSRAPNPCKSLHEAKDFYHASTGPTLLEQCPTSFLSEPRSSHLTIFSSYKEGLTCSFSLCNLSLGLCAWQMFVKLPQVWLAMLVSRRDPAVTY